MFSETLSQFRKDIIEDLSFTGVLFWFVFLPIIIILLTLAYEDLTNGFFLSKVERKTALLKQLYELEHEGITHSDNLSTTYSKTLAELNSYSIERPAMFRFLNHRLTLAFSTGMPLGLLIVLAVAFTKSRKDKTGVKVASAFGIGIALAGGAIALIITAVSNLLIGVSIVVAIQAGLVFYVVGSVFRETLRDLKANKAKDRSSTSVRPKR
jgi:hypothetical protein